MGKKAYAIILAAGQGRRVGANINKVFLSIAGKTVLEHTFSAFRRAACFDGIIIVCKSGERRYVERLAASVFQRGYTLVFGGPERQDSVQNALAVIPEDVSIIAVHDGARCLVHPSFINKCVKSAVRYGSGVAGKRATDTVKTLSGDEITQTLNRDHIALVETPQVFRAELLRRAYRAAAQDGFRGTDDASLVERLGVRPRLVVTHRTNLKITQRSDFRLGEYYLMNDSSFRVGHGYDAHRFTAGRPLVLGGVAIPWEQGLDGHSDADVLIHAIIDALLGAAGLPDIGSVFPDTDERFRGASSIALLEDAGKMLRQQGYIPGNIDATLVMQQPKIGPYRAEMARNIADALGIADERVNVKATTTEGMGFAGRGEGAAAHAVCMLTRTPAMTMGVER